MTLKQSFVAFVLCTAASALGIAIGMSSAPNAILFLGAPLMGALVTLIVVANFSPMNDRKLEEP